jgi:hypothetical protein
MTALQPNASLIGHTCLSLMFDSVAFVVPETSGMFYPFVARKVVEPYSLAMWIVALLARRRDVTV